MRKPILMGVGIFVAMAALCCLFWWAGGYDFNQRGDALVFLLGIGGYVSCLVPWLWIEQQEERRSRELDRQLLISQATELLATSLDRLRKSKNPPTSDSGPLEQNASNAKREGQK